MNRKSILLNSPFTNNNKGFKTLINKITGLSQSGSQYDIALETAKSRVK